MKIVYILPLLFYVVSLMKLRNDFLQSITGLISIKKTLRLNKKNKSDVCESIGKNYQDKTWCQSKIYNRKNHTWVNICKDQLHLTDKLWPNRYYYIEIICQLRLHKIHRELLAWSITIKI